MGHHTTPQDREYVRHDERGFLPRYELILEVCRMYFQALDAEDLNRRVVKILAGISGCDEAFVSLRNGDSEAFFREACYPENATLDDYVQEEITLASHRRMRMLAEEQTLLVLDFTFPVEDGDVFHQFQKAGLSCAIALPLIADETTVGFCLLAYRDRADADKADLEFLRFMGCLIGTVLHGRRLACDEAADHESERNMDECLDVSQDLYRYLSRMLEMIQNSEVARSVDRKDHAIERSEPFGYDMRLIERDKRMLGLLADGLTDKEIAEALYLSEGAVKKRLGLIYARLGFRNRAHAAAYAVREGFAS